MSNPIDTESRLLRKPVPHTAVCGKRVIVFSPDADLARVLLMNLEDRFQIVRECRLENLIESLEEKSPDLFLVDLHTHPQDIGKQLDVIRRLNPAVPVVVLRAYMSLSPEMNKSIDDLADIVFYKPVDVELVTQACEDLLK